jgi:hypothetical protein
MNRLVWKELRENFKWALLALAALALAEYHGIHSSQYGMAEDYYFNDGVTLCKTPFLTVTTFGCPVVGFLLGLIQILPELKRDRWAALLHRPVSRGVILRGKVVAGLILYAVATVPPFLYFVWLAATPRHFAAPFVPGMVQPGVADICTGAVYYFAALAVTLQRGGWIGLRVFPLLAAVSVSYWVLNNHYFHVAVEATVLMAIAIFTAAWGEIFSPELLRQRPWLARFAFLAVVFYGVCALGEMTASFFGVVGSSPHSKSIRYELSDQGVPLRLTYVDNVVIAVDGLDGKPLIGPDFRPDRVRNHIRYLNSFSNYIGNSHGWRFTPYRSSYRESRTYLWTNGAYMYPRLEDWFYLVRDRYMVGYLPTQKTPFAYLDQKGFEPTSAQPVRFSSKIELGSSGQATYCLKTPDSARLAFLSRQKMQDLALPEPAPIFGVGNAFATRGNTNVDVLGLSLTHELAVYDTKGTLITVLPYHQDMDRWGALQMGISPALDRFYLWYGPSAWIDGHTKSLMPSYVEEMNQQGQVLHTYTLPPLPNIPRERTWQEFISKRLQAPAYYFGTMLYKKIGAELGSKRLSRDFAWYSGKDGQREMREIVPFILIQSLLLAAVTLAWARHVYFSWRRAWAWAAFVFAFNLAGFLTFRLAADWPHLVACPTCGRKRPTEADHCPKCGGGWPAPPASGIEIFDQSRAEELTATSA